MLISVLHLETWIFVFLAHHGRTPCQLDRDVAGDISRPVHKDGDHHAQCLQSPITFAKFTVFCPARGLGPACSGALVHRLHQALPCSGADETLKPDHLEDARRGELHHHEIPQRDVSSIRLPVVSWLQDLPTTAVSSSVYQAALACAAVNTSGASAGLAPSKPREDKPVSCEPNL